MKIVFRMLITGIVISSFSQPVYAQFWEKVKSHAADVVNETVDKAMEGRDKKDQTTTGTTETAGTQKALNIPTPFDFKPGNKVIFEDDFSNDSIGDFPEKWKTNASGSVLTIPGIPGNWFLLRDKATYKLDSMLSMPENFTVEFDILASANEADDLSTVYFGFTRDNSVSSYQMNTGLAGTALFYMNEDEYKTDSKDLGKYHFGTFNLVNTLNKPMHVSISVKGTHMKIYLDKTRILDAEMFQPDSRKYFFVSAPISYDHGAKVLIGNVKIAQL